MCICYSEASRYQGCDSFGYITVVSLTLMVGSPGKINQKCFTTIIAEFFLNKTRCERKFYLNQKEAVKKFRWWEISQAHFKRIKKFELTNVCTYLIFVLRNAMKLTFRIDRWINKASRRAMSTLAKLSFCSMPIIRGGKKGLVSVLLLFQGKNPNWNKYFVTTTAWKKIKTG